MVLACLNSAAAPAATSRVYFNPASPPEAFAAKDIETALRARGYSVKTENSSALSSPPPRADVLVRFEQVPAGSQLVKPEGFSLSRLNLDKPVVINVFSDDAAGAMYGGLELAEQIRIHGVEGVNKIGDFRCSALRILLKSTLDAPFKMEPPSHISNSPTAGRTCISKTASPLFPMV